MKSRRVNCPEVKEHIAYRMACRNTGEVLESGDLAALLRQVATRLDTDDNVWKLYRIIN